MTRERDRWNPGPWSVDPCRDVGVSGDLTPCGRSGGGRPGLNGQTREPLVLFQRTGKGGGGGGGRSGTTKGLTGGGEGYGGRGITQDGEEDPKHSHRDKEKLP